MPINTAVGRCLFERRFEEAEQRFVDRVLRRGMTVVDVGANGGLYTVMCARAVGSSGRVIAFEPSPRELALLRRNVHVNQSTNVVVIPSAVAENPGTLKFAVSRDGGLNSLRATAHPAQSVDEWIDVDVTTLDHALGKLGIKTIDFLKVDVEGAERLVFAGAKETIRNSPDLVVLFEAADSTALPFGYCANDLLGELISWGWRVVRLDANGGEHPIALNDPRNGTEWINFIGFPPKGAL